MSSPPPPADSGAASALQLLQAHKHLRARQALLQDQPAHAAAHSGGDAALARLLATTAAVDELRADMADAGGWVLARQGGATTTYMQATPGASVARVRVEGWVDAPILSLLGVLYEVQLHHLWMPRHAGVGIRAGRMMHQFSPTAFWYGGVECGVYGRWLLGRWWWWVGLMGDDGR